MEIKITNVYSNIGQPEKKLKGSIGNAFLLEHPEGKILFDVGMRWKILRNNLIQLGIDPEAINAIVISHGHIDHARALKGFLKERKSSKKVEIYCHKSIHERRRMALLPKVKLWLPCGYPSLKPEALNKVEYKYLEDICEILPNIYYSGKIKDRPYKDNTVDFMQRKIEGKWRPDSYPDDVSLAIKGKDGLTLVGSCMHACLLNTCHHFEKLLGIKIVRVIGGIHTQSITEDQIYDIVKILKEKYKGLEMFLNHCSTKKSIEIFEKEFGTELVKKISVGSEFIIDSVK